MRSSRRAPGPSAQPAPHRDNHPRSDKRVQTSAFRYPRSDIRVQMTALRTAQRLSSRRPALSGGGVEDRGEEQMLFGVGPAVLAAGIY
eukprot:2884842-Rhodomonas_salina.1